nr:IS200/IS605 family accessory protein TnpB-related protein [Metallosphaera tengchongensis]
MEDSARKVGKWVVKVANSLNTSVIFLDDFNDLIKVKDLPSKFRDKLYLMHYRRLQYWVESQAKKTRTKGSLRRPPLLLYFMS